MLNYLIARGVFQREVDGRFVLNDLSRFLLDDHPSATRAWVDLEGFGGRIHLAFFELLATVRSGHAPTGGHKDQLDDDTGH